MCVWWRPCPSLSLCKPGVVQPVLPGPQLGQVTEAPALRQEGQRRRRASHQGTHRRTDPKLLPQPAFGSRPTTFPTDAELLPLLLAQGMMEALAALNFSRQRSKQVLTSSTTSSFSSCCTPVAVWPPPVESSLLTVLAPPLFPPTDQARYPGAGPFHHHLGVRVGQHPGRHDAREPAWPAGRGLPQRGGVGRARRLPRHGHGGQGEALIPIPHPTTK